MSSPFASGNRSSRAQDSPEAAPTYADVVAAPESAPQAPFANLRRAASRCLIQSGFQPGR